jgi:hypothetical protein
MLKNTKSFAAGLFIMGCLLTLAFGDVNAQTKTTADAFSLETLIFETLSQHDVAYFGCSSQTECKAVSGRVVNAQLTFQFDANCTSTACPTQRVATQQIVQVDLQRGKGELLLEDGKRFAVTLKDSVRIRLAGIVGEVQIAADQLGILLFHNQENALDLLAYTRLLDATRKLPTQHDVLVLTNHALFAGTMQTTTFELTNVSGKQTLQKTQLTEILFGNPDRVRLKNKEELTGTVTNKLVTIESLRLLSVGKEMLARILFERGNDFGGGGGRIEPVDFAE